MVAYVAGEACPGAASAEQKSTRKSAIPPCGRPGSVLRGLSDYRRHDAAELALGAICDHRGKLPPKEQHYLMDYLSSLQGLHPERDVHGKGYFRRLNRARTDVKHFGIFPDPKEWVRVGEGVHEYVLRWCDEYLGVNFEELDESELLSSPEIKR